MIKQGGQHFPSIETRNIKKRRAQLYRQLLHEPDPARQRILFRNFEKYVLDEQAHELFVLWQHRIVPYRSYLKGWKAGPSFYVNQDLATVWLDR